MKLMKCLNNHFYDGDIYSKCPHCKEGADDPKTEKLDHNRIHSGTGKEGKDTNDFWETAGQNSAQPEAPEDDLKSTIENLNVTEKLSGGVGNAGSNKRRDESYADSGKNIPDDEGKTVRFSSRQEDAKEPLVGWLVGLNGEVYGEGFPLVTGRNYIGRGADMDVVLRGDPSVSRNKHAIIIYDPKGRQFLLQPGESKELFYLDDKVVLDTQIMTNGCILCIGETRLRFVAFCGEDFAWETNS